MADEKISAMPDASALDGAELLPLVQAGINVKALLSAISQFVLQPPGTATMLIETISGNNPPQISILAGNKTGGALGNGGSLRIAAGNNTATGPGGTLYLAAGDSVDSVGGDTFFLAGNTTGNDTGGQVSFQAGNSHGSKGGTISLIAGNNSINNDGGDIVLTPGSGDNNNGKIITQGDVVAAVNYILRLKGYSTSNADPGGNIEITGGASNAGSGGGIAITGGSSASDVGGNLQFSPGDSSLSAFGGQSLLQLLAASSDRAGTIRIVAGDFAGGTGGDIVITTGAGTTAGNLFLNIPDADPHVAGAAYWLAGVLTKSAG